MRKKGGEYDYNNEKQYLYAKHSFRFETQCCLLNSSQKVAYTVVVFSFKFWRENPKKVT